MKIGLLDVDANQCLAILVDGAWQDPHGGVFTAEEQADMTEIAAGERDEMVLGANTKFERIVAPRLVCKL